MFRLLLITMLIMLSSNNPIAPTAVECYDYVPAVELTPELKVIKILSDSGFSVKMQEILLAQAEHESGSFKNSLSRKYNNVYAMLHSKYDPYSKGNYGFAEGRSGYAVYSSLDSSVYARIWYTRVKKYPKDANVYDYVAHIYNKGYFTGDPALTPQQNKAIYARALTTHISRNKHLFVN